MSKSLQNLQIRPLEKADLPAVKDFTDQWIGKDYYGLEELEQVFVLGQSENLNSSFVAFDGKKLVAIRLCYAPGSWQAAINKKGLSCSLWKVPFERVAYFKSLFVHEDYQRLGLGKTLSQKSLQVLGQMGAHAVLCHSWVESPENSSRLYLQKMGFSQVTVHPEFWKPIDYLCTRCAPGPCICSAAEMIYYFPGVSE